MDLSWPMTKDSLILPASICLACFGVITGVPLLFGIVRYQSKARATKQTLLNMLASTVCWINIWLLLIDRPLDIILFTSGPLSSPLCCIKVNIKFFLVCMIALTFNAIVVTRYLFILWIRNPMALNDKFWHNVITIWITSASAIITTVQSVGSGCVSTVFRICNGTAITPEEQDLPMFVLGALLVGSLLLHLVIKIRVKVYEAKVKLFPTNQLLFYKSAFIAELKKHELFSIAAIIICLIILTVGMGTTIRIKADTTSSNFEFSNMSNCFSHLVAPTLFLFIAVFTFYRKDSVREYVFKDLNYLVKAK